MNTNYSKPSALRWVTVGAACYLGWLVVNLGLAVIFPFLLLIDIFGGFLGKRFLRWLSVGLLRIFFLGYLPLVGLYRVRLNPGLHQLDSLGPCLVVANHRSWLDALLLIAVIPNVRVLVNSHYSKVPLVGKGMHWVESIFLDRNLRDSVRFCFDEVKQGLREGVPVAVFPEGTRSPIGRLKSFSSVFFRAAVDENVPVLPIALHLDRPFLGPRAENFLTDRRAVLNIHLLEIERPDPRDRGEDLAYRVQRKLSRILRKLDANVEQRGSRRTK
jgi:1-acyl-sn-glycerol-3-phosphate acyltransferase